MKNQKGFLSGQAQTKRLGLPSPTSSLLLFQAERAQGSCPGPGLGDVVGMGRAWFQLPGTDLNPKSLGWGSWYEVGVPVWGGGPCMGWGSPCATPNSLSHGFHLFLGCLATGCGVLCLLKGSAPSPCLYQDPSASQTKLLVAQGQF